jgi:hypothetical protein
MDDPPAPFIVGVSRSGTTLLRMMLDSHRDLAIPFETHFLPHIISRAKSGLTATDFNQIVIQSQSWPNMAIAAEALIDAVEEIEVFSPSKGLRAFYRLCAGRFGKQRWGEKTTHYVRIMNQIEELLPEAHFIHVIRDGRDASISLKKLWWGPGDDIEAAARLWVADINRARAQASCLRHYMEIRYESLVLEPVNTLRKISDYISIGFDQNMLKYYETAGDRLEDMIQPVLPPQTTDLDLDTFRSIHLNTKKPPDRSRIGRWRAEMSLDDQVRFESIAGSLLHDLGYETKY